MKKILSKKNIIISIIVLLIISIITTIYILTASYSFNIKFNEKTIDFFNEETLYFNENVSISFKGDGYKLKINDKKVKNYELKKEGLYTIEMTKFFKKYIVKISIDKDPLIYLVDNKDNVIHNYLSNTKSFKIVFNENMVYLNNYLYEKDTLIKNTNNYKINVLDKTYLVNILEIKK